ncbi:MAG: hypothetical protein RR654_07045 [Oscillospiraceae bacterium]
MTKNQTTYFALCKISIESLDKEHNSINIKFIDLETSDIYHIQIGELHPALAKLSELNLLEVERVRTKYGYEYPDFPSIGEQKRKARLVEYFVLFCCAALFLIGMPLILLEII